MFCAFFFSRIQASSPRLLANVIVAELPSIFNIYLFVYFLRAFVLVSLFVQALACPSPVKFFLLKSVLCGIFGSAGTEEGSLLLWLGKQSTKCNSSAIFRCHAYLCSSKIHSQIHFYVFAQKKTTKSKTSCIVWSFWMVRFLPVLWACFKCSIDSLKTRFKGNLWNIWKWKKLTAALPLSSLPVNYVSLHANLDVLFTFSSTQAFTPNTKRTCR